MANAGSVDRAIRVLLGIVVLTATAAFRTCPAYSRPGVSTCMR